MNRNKKMPLDKGLFYLIEYTRQLEMLDLCPSIIYKCLISLMDGTVVRNMVRNKYRPLIIFSIVMVVIGLFVHFNMVRRFRYLTSISSENAAKIADNLPFVWLIIIVVWIVGFLVILKSIRRIDIEGRLSNAESDKDSAPGADDEPQEKKVFMSYRREGGATVARLLRTELQSRNVESFLDVDDLSSSYFDEKLFTEIEAAPNFILILSPNALDRCVNPDDWMRKELAHAIMTGRNIIPVLVEDFTFPDAGDLPEEIRDIPRYNSLEYNHTYFSAMLEKLVKFLK